MIIFLSTGLKLFDIFTNMSRRENLAQEVHLALGHPHFPEFHITSLLSPQALLQPPSLTNTHNTALKQSQFEATKVLLSYLLALNIVLQIYTSALGQSALKAK